jgi:hypothetical protein
MRDTRACSGCREDFYNHRGADAGSCWSLKEAKLVTKYRIYFMTPPTQKGAFTKVRVPDCYRQVNNGIFYDRLPDFVKPSDLNRANRKKASHV